MIANINSWVQGIILAIIIATIIEIILPEGNNKKYVKTIIGIYVMFVIIHPLISIISNKKIDINKIIDDTNYKLSKFESNDITLETNAYIEQTYKQKIEEDIYKNLKEKGYNIDFLNLYIEIEDETNYGSINNIDIKVSKIKDKTIEEDDRVNKVENINIQISDNKSENKNVTELEEISEEERSQLKEFLNDTYGVPKEKVHINE
mgnify:CR=1 FL=1